MKNYIELALKTELKDYKTVSERFTPTIARLMHAGMGLTTEANEFLDTLKKSTMYGKPLDKVNLIEEISDLFWYCAIACDVLGVSFEQVQELNINKLKARYGEKYSDEKAVNRNLNIEREVLEIDLESFKDVQKKYTEEYLSQCKRDPNPQKQKVLLVNAIKCSICGDVLISRHKHDYKDCSCGSCSIDGGIDYRRLKGYHTDLAVYTDDHHLVIREVFEWGSYGKDGKQDLHFIKLKDMTTDHIKNIIRTQTLRTEILQIFNDELLYREC